MSRFIVETSKVTSIGCTCVAPVAQGDVIISFRQQGFLLSIPQSVEEETENWMKTPVRNTVVTYVELIPKNQCFARVCMVAFFGLEYSVSVSCKGALPI